jgi:N-acetylmuramoyl-L-alanine amidase CwlA
MNIINKNLSLEEFTKYIGNYNFGETIPKKIVIHHTWKPTKKDWNGVKTIEGLKKFYTSKGWSKGPHLFIAEDGIWLFSPMSLDGIHAGEGNTNSIGIEVVGDYDVEKWSGKTKDNAIGAIRSLMAKLNINTENVKFHNDYSTKSCPGHAITKEWLFRELNFYNQEDEIPDWGNVSHGRTAKDIWEFAMEKGWVSEDTKFNDRKSAGEMMIYLSRIFPEKF